MNDAEKGSKKEANNTARRGGRKNGKIYREMAITGKLFRPENMRVQSVTLLCERHTCLPGDWPGTVALETCYRLAL